MSKNTHLEHLEDSILLDGKDGATDAFKFLDHLSCNKLPSKDGRIGLTLFHAPNGGIMAEQTISRIDKEFILTFIKTSIFEIIREVLWTGLNTSFVINFEW